VGLGTDGRAWGGELLRPRRGGAFERPGTPAGTPCRRPTGAAREPWRMAAAGPARTGRGADDRRTLRPPGCGDRHANAGARVQCPATSSAGRWFDRRGGAARLCAELFLRRAGGDAARRAGGGAWSPSMRCRGGIAWATMACSTCWPLLAHLADINDAARGAALFHATLSAGLAEWVAGAAHRTGLSVSLWWRASSNHVLSRRCVRILSAGDCACSEARAHRPTDGGLRFGAGCRGPRG